MKTVRGIYIQTLAIQYILFVIFGIIFKILFKGSDATNKVFVLLIVGGLIYLPIIAIINLTQFWCVKEDKIQNKYSGRGFFLPTLLIAILTIYKFDYLLLAAFSAQLVASIVGYRLLKLKEESHNLKIDKLNSDKINSDE